LNENKKKKEKKKRNQNRPFFSRLVYFSFLSFWCFIFFVF